MAVYRIGTMIRETGQALERLGCRLIGIDAFREDILRHRAVMNIGFVKPDVAQTSWVAPNASVVGNVKLEKNTSVWYGAVIKGDESAVVVGEGTNIQDGAVVGVGLTTSSDRMETKIGKNVTVGHRAVLSGCTVEDSCLIGMHAVVQHGSVIEAESMLAAGAVIPPNTRVPSHQLWAGHPATYMRDLKDAELQFLPESAQKYTELAQQHQSITTAMQKKLDA